ncbi:MAG: hypothetical protein GY765_43585 [bacterium]|nr:hypothetical protein [bacterium]
MKKHHHIILTIVMLSTWAVFYLAGISSNYYMDWSATSLILLTFLGAFAIVPFIGGVTLVLLPGLYLRNSIWVAFYASLIPFVMDFVLVGLIGGKGFAFLFSHWFLSLAYIYVWIVLPLIGLSLQSFRRRLQTT